METKSLTVALLLIDILSAYVLVKRILTRGSSLRPVTVNNHITYQS